MLKIPTIIKKSTLKDCDLGVFITEPLSCDSLLIEEDSLGVIELTRKQLDLIVMNVSQLQDEKQKIKLLKTIDLFNFNKSKMSLTISNLAYINYNSNNYNIQYINNNLYAIRNIEKDEELICSSIKVVKY
jgi:hypothetical protein